MDSNQKEWMDAVETNGRGGRRGLSARDSPPMENADQTPDRLCDCGFCGLTPDMASRDQSWSIFLINDLKQIMNNKYINHSLIHVVAMSYTSIVYKL